MTAPYLRLLVCIAVAASLAGCGGGSSSSGGGGGGGGGTGGSPTTVTFTFNNTPDNALPVAVASQIGAGSYTLATLTSNKLTLSIPSGESNFAVAYLCPSPTGFSLAQNFEYITQASTLDGTSFTGSCVGQNESQTGTATVQVNAAAIPGAAWVDAGFGLQPWTGSTLNFNMQLNTGTYDLPVSVLKNELFADNYLAIRILRNQTIPGALNNGAPVVFTTSDEVVTQPITYANLPSGFSLAKPLVVFETSGGAEIVLDDDGPIGQYLSLPAAAVQSGDTYFFSVAAYGSSSSTTSSSFIAAERFSSTGGPQTFTLPAPWSYAGPTAATLPTFNFSYTGFSGSASVSDLASILWNSGDTTNNQIVLTSTSNYQHGSTEVSIPDLSSVTGFLTPPASGSITWTAEILQDGVTGAHPASGTIQVVGANGAFNLQ